MRTQFHYLRQSTIDKNDNIQYDPNFGITFAAKCPTRSELLQILQRKLNGELNIKLDIEVGAAECRNERFVKSVGRQIAIDRLKPMNFGINEIIIGEKSTTFHFQSEDGSYVYLACPIVGTEESVRLIDICI